MRRAGAALALLAAVIFCSAAAGKYLEASLSPLAAAAEHCAEAKSAQERQAALAALEKQWRAKERIAAALVGRARTEPLSDAIVRLRALFGGGGAEKEIRAEALLLAGQFRRLSRSGQLGPWELL